MKVEKRLVLLLILSAALTTMFLASFTSTVRAAASTEMVIQPTQPSGLMFPANFTAPPANLAFNLSVVNVTNLGSWQAAVQFNESLLGFVNFSIPTDDVLGAGVITAGPILNSPGVWIFGGSAAPGFLGFNGSGVLAQFNLNVTTVTPPVSCNVDFEGLSTDTFLTAINLGDIPFTPVTVTYTYTYLQGTTVTHSITGSTNLVTTTTNGTIQPNSEGIDTTTKTLSFNITGNTGDTAFLYAELPKDVIHVTTDPWNVTINGVLQPQSAYQITENATYTKIFVLQFAFGSQVAVGVQGNYIIPELSNVLIVMLIASSVAVAVAKGKTRKKQ